MAETKVEKLELVIQRSWEGCDWRAVRKEETETRESKRECVRGVWLGRREESRRSLASIEWSEEEGEVRKGRVGQGRAAPGIKVRPGCGR
jgi:hypothetical protein